AGVDGVGKGETEAHQVGLRGVYDLFRYLVETGFADAGDEHGMQGAMRDVQHRGDVPVLNLHRGGDLSGLALGGLAHGQRHARGRLGQIFAEDEHRIVAFYVAHRRHRQRAVLQQVADQPDILQLVGGDAAVEVLRTDQRTQGVVAFQAGAWRADADYPLAAQQLGGAVQGGIDAEPIRTQQR